MFTYIPSLSTEQSFLCYTVSSHYLPILYIVSIVYICQSQSPNSSLPFFPLGIHRLCLCFILWNYVNFVSLSILHIFVSLYTCKQIISLTSISLLSTFWQRQFTSILIPSGCFKVSAIFSTYRGELRRKKMGSVQRPESLIMVVITEDRAMHEIITHLCKIRTILYHFKQPDF